MNTSKNHVRVSITMPRQLLQKLDKYCNSIMKGRPRIRSAVISQAIEEFLNRRGKKGGDD